MKYRSPAPHLCLEFASTAQIYITVARIGAVAQNEAVIAEVAGLLSALIDTEEEEFLSNGTFARYLMVFVDRTCGVGNLNVGEDTEADIIEILFGIAAKIRLQPEILAVWFQTRGEGQVTRQEQSKKKNFVGVTSKEDFPLCYQLIDHVFHDGKMGDFSRTGLLYIFEAASKSPALEQWIVESDLPTLMATGLGALYSQLSRKLSILHPDTDMPIILTLSDYAELDAPSDADNVYSENAQRHLETFLSYLLFWQDVLDHCRSVDVKQTLLDHFQVLFLEQLLYPSLLESSDRDGGSSVAVLAYLRRMLEALDAVELVDLMLQYLLAIADDSSASQLMTPRSQSTMRRRASLIQLTQPEDEDDRPNPALFSLADLLQSSVTSLNPQTVMAALQLSTVILGKDHKYCIDTLLQTAQTSEATPRRTHGALDAEINAYVDIAASIGGEASLEEAYDSQLKDALRLVESHACSAKPLSLSIYGVVSTVDSGTAPQSRVVDVEPHYIRLDDPFLNHVCSALRTFLTNNIEVNLSLTEILATLASCPYLRLEGWLSVEPSHYRFPSDPEDSSDVPEALKKLREARQHPTWLPEDAPALLDVLQSLQSEVQQLASALPNFRQQIVSRKQAFRLHDEISEAMVAAELLAQQQLSAQRRSMDQQSPGFAPGSWTPQKAIAQPPSLLQGIERLMGSGANTPTRSQSPRGRNIGPDFRHGPTSSPSPARPRGFFNSAASPSRSRPRDSVSGPADPQQQQQQQPQQALLDDVMEAATSAALAKRIKFPLRLEEQQARGGAEEEETESSDDEDDEDEDNEAAEPREASLSHILTNVVILQEFILEMAAIMQVRASMFSEVVFVAE